MNETEDIDWTNNTYDGRLTWIACETSLVVMTIIVLYVCVCLGYFASNERHYTRVRSNTFSNESNRCDIQPSSLREDRNLSVSKTKRTLRAAMRYACLLSGVSTLLKLLLDQLKFFYAWNAQSDDVCEALYDVTDIIVFYVAYMSVYAFLWIKQWLFYCDPVAAKFLYSKNLVLFSKIFVCVVFLLSLAVAVLNLIPVRFKVLPIPQDNNTALLDSSYVGCVAVYDMRIPSTRWPLVLYCALNAVFQCTLMGLFIYPLIWHRVKKWKLQQHQRSSEIVSIHGNLRRCDVKGRQNELRKCGAFGRRHQSVSGRMLSKNALDSIQRTVFWTSVCIGTDATLVITFAILNVGTPMILTAVASDIVLLTNVLCIVATYKTWKNILFPFCGKTLHRDLIISSTKRGST